MSDLTVYRHCLSVKFLNAIAEHFIEQKNLHAEPWQEKTPHDIVTELFWHNTHEALEKLPMPPISLPELKAVSDQHMALFTTANCQHTEVYQLGKHINTMIQQAMDDEANLSKFFNLRQVAFVDELAR